MEKQANNLNNKLLKVNFTQLIITLSFLVSFSIKAQNNTFKKEQRYTIEDITVSGNTNFNPQTVIAYSRLKKGEEVISERHQKDFIFFKKTIFDFF